MRHIDLAGIPSSGKSTIAYPVFPDRWPVWDGLLPPAHWQPYIDELTTLFRMVADHPSFVAVVRMNNRTARKMATVERLQDSRVFLQAGHIQRILGFGWRLADLGRDVNLIRPALRKMPVSAGAAFLEVTADELARRNAARRLVPETAHEDRTFQIEPMLKAIPIAKEVLRERGVTVREIDAERQSIDAARAELVAFADEGAGHAAQGRSGGEGTVLQPPPWWQ